jgi:hypothetical protein
MDRTGFDSTESMQRPNARPQSPAATDRSSPSVWGGEGELHLSGDTQSANSTRDSENSMTTAFSSSSDYHYSFSEAQSGPYALSRTGLESGVFKRESITTAQQVVDMQMQLVQMQSERLIRVNGSAASRLISNQWTTGLAWPHDALQSAAPGQPESPSLPRERRALPSSTLPPLQQQAGSQSHAQSNAQHFQSSFEAQQPTEPLPTRSPAAANSPLSLQCATEQPPHEHTPRTPRQVSAALYLRSQQSPPDNTQEATATPDLVLGAVTPSTPPSLSPSLPFHHFFLGGGSQRLPLSPAFSSHSPAHSAARARHSNDELERIAADLDQAMMMQSLRYAGVQMN